MHEIDAPARLAEASAPVNGAAAYRMLLASTPDAVLVVDETGRCLDANAQALGLLGSSRDQLLQRPAAEIFESWPPRIDQTWVTGEVRREDDIRIPVHIASSLLPETADAGPRFVVFLRSLHEGSGAEAAWARLASIVTSSPAAIIGSDLDGVIVSWNPAAERLYGYTTAEAIGESIRMLVPPGGKDTISPALERVRRGESLRNVEVERMTRDGRRIVTSVSVSPVLDTSGRVVAVSSIAYDITALRDAEQALRLRNRAVSAAPNGVVITDTTLPYSRIVDVNPAFEAMTGYTREEVIGREFGFLRGPGTDPAPLQRLVEGISAGRDVTETLLNYRKDGTPYWVELRVAAVRDEAGVLTHFVGIQTDVTASRAAEEALARERDLLKAVMAHLPDPVYVKDTASRFIRLNQATAQTLGIADPEQAIGKSDADFFPESLAREYLADEQRLFATGEPMLNKPERQSVMGNQRWVLATKAPLRDAAGQIIGLVGSNRDITEQILLQEERDRLHAELEAEIQRAAKVQAQLLPQAAPDVPGYDFAGICLPARQVGGDFFDWVSTPDGRVRVSLGDVMGKGLPASLLTATARAALRSLAEAPLPGAIDTVNRVLYPDLVQSDSFITLFHASLDPATGRLTYVDAGHGMALIQRRDGEVEPLRQRGLPLGVQEETAYRAGVAMVQPGDTLVLYSDGLPDARPDLQLDPAGVAARLDGAHNAAAKLERLVALAAEAGARPDDLTLVVIRREEAMAALAAAPATPERSSR
ncbi:MAG: PAS domain S-box protein [Thermomicrobiales bacterium]|nr:PAS domain S-box protein [Thermomicrobiales bacterium]